MSDVNQLQLSWQKETSFGVPNSGANFQEFGVVSGSMTRGKQSARSNQIRSDAQRAAAVALGIQPGIQYDFELAAKAMDDLIQGMIRASSAWSTTLLSKAGRICCVTRIASRKSSTKGLSCCGAGMRRT